MRVFFIDVGQDDAILVRAGADFDALIDGGRRSAGQTVLETLRWLGVYDLEVLLATHGSLPTPQRQPILYLSDKDFPTLGERWKFKR